MNEPNPFLDPARQRELYGHASRLAGRTSALMRAKTAGHPVPETIVSLVQTHHARPDRLGVVLDIGCGRGTSSLVIAEQLRPKRVVGLDAAPSLLAQARERAKDLPDSTVEFVEGDFHDLSLPDGSSDIVVAAFCLYHSPRPEDVVGQIARVLAPGGLAVLVTKGLDSYREMDQLVASAGLDSRAAQRESLYTAAHSGNLANVVASSLDVIAVLDEEHVFTFDSHDHTAQYLATNPKYDLAPGLYGNPGALAATLHEFLPDRPLTTRSRITFVVAQPKEERRAGMSPAPFTKHYAEPERAACAVRHYRWLTAHAKPLRQPALHTAGPRFLTFERIEGRPVRPEDLPRMAELLGHAHGAAWASDLHSASLDTPHHFQDGTQFDDYLGPRRIALRRRHEQGYLPNKTALHAMLGLLEATAEGPCAFYKDSNPRNFIITTQDIVAVDTDDLSLAPLGYDLAKLIATLHLTYGPLTDQAVTTALLAYNAAARRHDARLGTTDRGQLDSFLGLHAVLTAPYVGRNGYRYSLPLRFSHRGAS